MHTKIIAAAALALFAFAGAANAAPYQAHAGLFDQGGAYYRMGLGQSENAAPVTLDRTTVSSIHQGKAGQVQRTTSKAFNPAVPADNPRNEPGLGLFDAPVN